MRRRSKLLLALVIGVAALVAAIAWLASRSGPMSDAEVKNRFAEHRADFEDLCRRFPSGGVSEVSAAERGRGGEWTAWLARVGALSIATSGAEVDIVLARSGIVVSGSTTSIVCASSAPAPVVQDSARMRGLHGRQCAQLDRGWWICREWN